MVIQNMMTVLKKIFVQRTQLEALIGMDFGLTERRAGLMQLCFSILNRWWFLLVIGLIVVNPIKGSVHQIWGVDSSLVNMMFDEKILIPFIIGAVVATVIPLPLVWLACVFILQAQGDVHLVFSLALMAGIFFAEIRKGLKKALLLQGQVRRYSLWFYGLSLISYIAAGYLQFNLFYYLKWAGFFNGSMTENRYEFLTLSWISYSVIQITVVSVWGHFYSKRTEEPNVWNLKYSSATLISNWLLSASFKQDLKLVVQSKLKEKEAVKVEETKGFPRKLLEMHEEEKTFLQYAEHQLS